MSRGFLCALAGIAITIFSWFSPWLWPAWPAFALIELAFPPERPFWLSTPARGTVVVILISWNIAVWSVALRIMWSLVSRLKQSSAPK